MLTHSVFKIFTDYSSEEFEVILNMLKLPELKSLCQSFQITSAIQRKTKLKLVQAVLEYRRKQQTIIGNQRSEVSPINSRYIVVYCTVKQ